MTEDNNPKWRAARELISQFGLTEWPDYVIKELLIAQGRRLHTPEDYEQLKDDIKTWLKDFPVKAWKLENRNLTLDSFNDWSKKELVRRVGELQQLSQGTLAASDQTLDPARQQRMQDRLKQQGPTQEPIIAFQKPDGLELMEGWHRTQQSLALFPEGYPARIWVGYT
ncbi:unnamed protein product [marine sediment metagenome]|uniref:ParB/Sulfiredoxin domain-containing protein n=1 Tax=marine sediment metagenome TaxID=412755 RepID=X1ATH3_9ZZZZ